MALLVQDELQALVSPRSGPCISIYLPTHRAAPEKRQNPAELKRLVRQADERLRAQGVRDLRREELLVPAWLRIENPSLWEHPGFGMALFLAPDYVQEYHLPLPFSPLVAVGDRSC